MLAWEGRGVSLLGCVAYWPHWPLLSWAARAGVMGTRRSRVMGMPREVGCKGVVCWPLEDRRLGVANFSGPRPNRGLGCPPTPMDGLVGLLYLGQQRFVASIKEKIVGWALVSLEKSSLVL